MTCTSTDDCNQTRVLPTALDASFRRDGSFGQRWARSPCCWPLGARQHNEGFIRLLPFLSWRPRRCSPSPFLHPLPFRPSNSMAVRLHATALRGGPINALSPLRSWKRKPQLVASVRQTTGGRGGAACARHKAAAILHQSGRSERRFPCRAGPSGQPWFERPSY